MIGQTLIIGHRGASHDAPENTLASFRLAFEQGADGVEADFRLSADGKLVCLHDGGTARTAGAQLEVARSSWEDLSRLEVGGWKGEHWRGEPIPTLGQALELLPAGKSFFIELKSGPELVEPLAAQLAASGADPACLRLLCFDAQLIAQLKARLPGLRACWLTDYRWRAGWHPSPREVLETLRRIGADGLASRSRSVLDRDFVAALREESREIHVWTVDRAREARRLLELGVDSIMTNRPGWLSRSLRDGSAPASGSLGTPGGCR